MTAEWAPAFDGQRPPFEPGHELSLKSGAWSPRHVDPRADALIAEVAADQATSYLSAPAYAPVLRQWAVAAARLDLMSEWLDGMTMAEQTTPPKGARNARAPIEVYRSMLTAVTNLADKLGLTPLSRARLGKDLAVSTSIAGRQLAEWQARGAEMAARDQEAKP